MDLRKIETHKPFRITKSTANDYRSMLKSRVNAEQKKFASLTLFLNADATYASQLEDHPKENEYVADKYPNENLEVVYKLQHWAAMAYDDDVLSSILESPEVSVLLNHYQHFFEAAPSEITFVQTQSAIEAIAKAAFWARDILEALSKYIPCLPIYILPVVLSGYPDKKNIQMLAPGVFIFDMIHLFPEIFPFCKVHQECENFCFAYNARSVESHRTLKLIAAVLSLTDLHVNQLNVLFHHAISFDPKGPQTLAQFKAKAESFIHLDETKLQFELIRSKISEFEENSCLPKNPSAGRTHRQRLLPKKVVSAVQSLRNEEEIQNKDEMVPDIAIRLFIKKNVTEMSQDDLHLVIQERITDVGTIGLNSLEIRHILTETPYFDYTTRNTVLFYNEGRP